MFQCPPLDGIEVGVELLNLLLDLLALLTKCSTESEESYHEDVGAWVKPLLESCDQFMQSVSCEHDHRVSTNLEYLENPWNFMTPMEFVNCTWNFRINLFLSIRIQNLSIHT